MQILRVSGEQVRQVARLREVAGVEVAETESSLWLRAAQNDESLNRLLAGLGGERFALYDREWLVPWGANVPTEKLPMLKWTAIRTWATMALPVAALCGELTSRQPLRVVRGGNQQPPAALLTDWQRWFDYGATAPEVRLRPLAFALSADGRAFICGSPLPPLLGHFYAIDEGIATPCGWSLSPAVGSAVIRNMLRLAEEEMAMFATDGTFERIAGEHFVQASRSALRASARGEAYV